MSTINNTSTADEAYAQLQRERFPLEHPQLVSLSEAVNTCPGFQEPCGDEIPADCDLCPAHLRDEDLYYTRLAQEQDRREAEDAGSPYRAQYLEQMKALRAVRDSQIPLMEAIGKDSMLREIQ